MSYAVTASLPPEAASFSATATGARALRRQFPGLTGCVAALGALGVVCLAGLALDPREITGVPAWLKPLKFCVSGALYAGTLAVLMRPLAGRRLARVVDWGVGGILVFETVLIAAQAARGVTSHFNVSTPLDAAIFASMGVAIATLSVLTLVAAVALVRAPQASGAMKRAAVWGLALSLAGGSVGGLMTQPTPDQIAAFESGPPQTVGAHTVGVADGGAGLPVTGWSTEGGDLRVPHFWGLHALQALPLLALALGRLPLGARQRGWLVHVGGLVYGGVLGVLLWQALRGQPLLAPDSATLGALGAVLGAGALATLAIVRWTRAE